MRKISNRAVRFSGLVDDPLEREIQATHVRMFKEAGFVVRSLSQRRSVVGDLVGFPDVIAFYQDATVLIEEKKKGGRVREEQLVFRAAILPNQGDHLFYLLAPTDNEVWDLINRIRALPWRSAK